MPKIHGQLVCMFWKWSGFVKYVVNMSGWKKCISLKNFDQKTDSPPKYYVPGYGINFEICTLLSCEWGNPAENGVGRFKIYMWFWIFLFWISSFAR